MKDTLKDFFIYSSGTILQSALNFFLIPLYIRVFPPDTYGVISVLVVLQSLFTLFVSGGMVNGLIRLYYETEGDRRKQLAGNTWLWYLFLSGLVGGIIALMAPALSQLLFQSTSYAVIIRILSLVFFLSTANIVPIYILRLNKKSRLYSFFLLLNSIIDFSLKIYLIVYLKQGLYGYFESSAVSNFLVLCLITPFIARHIILSIHFPSLKQLLRLGAPYILSGFAVWVLEVSDRLLLTRFSGETTVGVYSLAYNFANLFTVFLTIPISLLLDPYFFTFAAKNSTDDTKRLLKKMFNLFVFAGGVLYLMIALGSQDLLRLLNIYFGAKVKYLEAAPLIPIITLSIFFYFLSLPATLSGLYIKKPGIGSIVCAIAALANLFSNFFFIPKFGAWGAAMTTLAAYALFGGLFYYWTEKIFPVGYSWKETFKALFYLLFALTIGWQINSANPFFSFFARVGIGTTIFVLLTSVKFQPLVGIQRSEMFSELLRIVQFGKSNQVK